MSIGTFIVISYLLGQGIILLGVSLFLIGLLVWLVVPRKEHPPFPARYMRWPLAVLTAALLLRGFGYAYEWGLQVNHLYTALTSPAEADE